jgi:hypothetical protein
MSVPRYAGLVKGENGVYTLIYSGSPKKDKMLLEPSTVLLPSDWDQDGTDRKRVREVCQRVLEEHFDSGLKPYETYVVSRSDWDPKFSISEHPVFRTDIKSITEAVMERGHIVLDKKILGRWEKPLGDLPDDDLRFRIVGGKAAQKYATISSKSEFVLVYDEERPARIAKRRKKRPLKKPTLRLTRYPYVTFFSSLIERYFEAQYGVEMKMVSGRSTKYDEMLAIRGGIRMMRDHKRIIKTGRKGIWRSMYRAPSKEGEVRTKERFRSLVADVCSLALRDESEEAFKKAIVQLAKLLGVNHDRKSKHH